MLTITLERKVEYGLRVIGYLLVALIYYLLNFSNNPIVHGAVCGFLFADYITWIGRNLMKLPDCMDKLALDSIIAVVVAVVMFGLVGVRLPSTGEGMAVGFLVFIPVLFINASVIMVQDALDS